MRKSSTRNTQMDGSGLPNMRPSVNVRSSVNSLSFEQPGRIATRANSSDMEMDEASMKKLASMSSLGGTFIRSEMIEEDDADTSFCVQASKTGRHILRHMFYESICGFVVFMDFVAICRDADTTAANPLATDAFSETVMACCFCFYVLDLSLRAFAHGCGTLKSRSHMLDLFVIAVSVFEKLLEMVQGAFDSSSLLMIRMLRLCRLLRLVRVIKLFAGMKELRRLTQMIATCARTMFWSFLMAFLVMTMWAVVAVELTYPVARRMEEQGVWPNCERCPRAFGSVMAANLTFFQIVLAGDSWGTMALPIIEAEPMTAIVFCGASLTLSFGIMQLITAVVVDTFAELRKHDVATLAVEMESVEREEKEWLSRVFRELDEDGSGQVTFQELTEGALRVRDFQDWLRVMDVDSHDLERLFSIIDADDSGEIDVVEFIEILYRLRHSDATTMGKLMKHMLDNLEKKAQQIEMGVGALHRRLEGMDMMGEAETSAREPSAGRRAHAEEAETVVLADLDASVREACVVALEAALSAAIGKVQAMGSDGGKPPDPDVLSNLRGAAAAATTSEPSAAKPTGADVGVSSSFLRRGGMESHCSSTDASVRSEAHDLFQVDSQSDSPAHHTPDDESGPERIGDCMESRNWATCLLEGQHDASRRDARTCE
eukprot:TRINITY_DN25127_c0_g2_i1.p1 TRINITY_DN25127_c0_g2~~TRINITY_DN25127_c0_g2_i1.p1  ORF type:complete len:658 (+),score=139.22 TRINITY_DN25127_c0_g2_i1:86-2059(+)